MILENIYAEKFGKKFGVVCKKLLLVLQKFDH
jgi:hypothetical protein